jgi:hypothetical protein
VRKEGYDPFITDLVLAPGIGRTFEFQSSPIRRTSSVTRRRVSPRRTASA